MDVSQELDSFVFLTLFLNAESFLKMDEEEGEKKIFLFMLIKISHVNLTPCIHLTRENDLTVDDDAGHGRRRGQDHGDDKASPQRFGARLVLGSGGGAELPLQIITVVVIKVHPLVSEISSGLAHYCVNLCESKDR